MEYPLALPPQNNEAFLREVDEELRRDELLKMWRRWGIWAVIALVIGLAAFGGYLLYQNRIAGDAGAQGEQFDGAIRDLSENKTASGQAALAKLAGSGNVGYRALAKMNEANLLLTKDDLKGAAAKFAEIADDSTLPQPLRDIALIRRTSAEYDTLKPEIVVQRMTPLATPDSPWFGSAGEMLAVAKLRLGKKAEAGKLFGEIARGEKVPATLRERAVQMAGVLGVDAIDQSGEKKAK